MLARSIVVAFILLFSGCQSGLIPCPTAKAPKMKKSAVPKKIRYSERTAMASAREVKPETTVQRNDIHQNYYRSDSKPLQHIDVEEWDCPRPGGAKKMPKSVQNNIKKNRKSLLSDYKHRVDSLNAPAQR